mgnify:FL=1
MTKSLLHMNAKVSATDIISGRFYSADTLGFENWKEIFGCKIPVQKQPSHLSYCEGCF